MIVYIEMRSQPIAAMSAFDTDSYSPKTYVEHVKAFAKREGIPYREAMKLASDSWHKQKGGGRHKSRNQYGGVTHPLIYDTDTKMVMGCLPEDVYDDNDGKCYGKKLVYNTRAKKGAFCYDNDVYDELSGKCTGLAEIRNQYGGVTHPLIYDTDTKMVMGCLPEDVYDDNDGKCYGKKLVYNTRAKKGAFCYDNDVYDELSGKCTGLAEYY